MTLEEPERKEELLAAAGAYSKESSKDHLVLSLLALPVQRYKY
jgi:hypothetical protein